MTIDRDPEELNVKRAVQFVKPVKDMNGDIVHNLYVSDDCKLYDIDEYNSHMYSDECPEAKYTIYIDKRGRRYSCINCEKKNYITQVARAMKISFDEGKYLMSYYNDLEIDHIDPRVPLNNCLENVEFVTHDENMRRAGETGVMIKKYQKDLIHQICQMTCDGVPRAEIMEKLHVNGQLVDDVRAGRSHKSVSSQYLDKGFEYKTFDRNYRDDLLHRICKAIEEDPDMRVCDINRKLGGNVDHRLISAIRNKQCYTRISKDYNF